MPTQKKLMYSNLEYRRFRIEGLTFMLPLNQCLIDALN